LRDELENERNFMSRTLQDSREKQNKEIQDLEKEIMTRKEENRMLDEDRADFENKWETARQENENLQSQVIEKQELINENQRNLTECQTKLAITIKENEAQQDKMIQIESDLHQQIKTQTEKIEELDSK
jgi:chromosome segregation ATPase